jgi:molybdopterin converting factor small subunit
MRVTLRFFAQVKAAAGEPRREVELPDGATVADALRAAIEENPGLSRFLVRDDGELNGTVLLFVGEESVDPDDGRPLRDGEAVDVMSPISGG